MQIDISYDFLAIVEVDGMFVRKASVSFLQLPKLWREHPVLSSYLLGGWRAPPWPPHGTPSSDSIFISKQNTKPHLLPSTAVPFSSKEKFSTTRLRVACLGIIGWVFNGWIVPFPRGACVTPPPPTMLMSGKDMFCWVDKHPTVSRLHRILCY